MERYLQIGKENLKHNIPLHMLVSIFLLCLSPFLLGVANLEASDTAKVLEMYVAFIGIIMLTPIFLPEQNKDLRDLVYSKHMNASTVYLIRILESVMILFLFLGIYIGMLYFNNCKMNIGGYFFGTLAEMLFIGGLGIFSYGLFDNLIIGYMLPVIYYILAIGSGDKYLKLFYPFSMSLGSYEEKFYLLAGGMILIIIGVILRSRRH